MPPRSPNPHSNPDWEWRRATTWNTAPNIRRRGADYPVDSENERTLMWNGVGGSTTVYTATWPRFRPSDFRKGTKHGLQPDWPISYEDLAPWFEAHDAIAGVSGHPGDPAMPERGPFPTPPLPPGPVGPIVAKGFRKLGWHYWPMPAAIVSEEYNGRPACNNCGACQSGCPRGSLHNVAFTVWPRALAAGTDLRPFARVLRIESDDSGRATGATYVDRTTGQRWFQPARHVVVAGNGVGTPRLLLNSATRRFPHGLANSSDQVGRNLMHHGLATIEAWTDTVTDSHKGIISAVHICEEFAETDPSRGFVNGVTLHICKQNGAGYQANGSHSGNVAPWGEGHHAWFRRHFGHGFTILVVGDDLPLPENRVTLSPDQTDTDGMPAAKIAYRLCDNDRRQMDFGIARAVELAHAVDAFDIKVNDFSVPGKGYHPGAWHLLGTCRMGSDPADSVVDQWHRAWDVPNLSIMDGSVLPTGGAVNPTSTIGALVLRAAAHLRDDLTGEPGSSFGSHAI